MKTFCLTLIFILSGCATNRDSILALSSGAGILGGIVETARAPDGDNKLMHSVLGASVFAAAGALAGLYIFDEQKAHDKTKAELAFKTAQMEELKRSESKIGHELKGASISDADVEEIIKRGQGKLFELNHWNWINQTEAVHENQYLKLNDRDSK